MIVLLLVTKNEGTLLRENLRHHLNNGFDRIAVADNCSTDTTREIANEFKDAVVWRSFDNFHARQTVRHEMLHSLDDGRGDVAWAGIADTDEFFWPSEPLRDILDRATPSTVAINFGAKLFLPTAVDPQVGSLIERRRYRTSGGGSPLHTSYVAGKTVYRAEWLMSIPTDHWCARHEHLCMDAPTDRVATGPDIVNHYMIQDEDQFVEKVVRLIEWAKPPKGMKAQIKWRTTPKRMRPLPHWTEPWKKVWWGVYQSDGIQGIRSYYRNSYVVPADDVARHVSDGNLTYDDGLAIARSQVQP